jgi:Tat protein translocase TatC
MQPSSAITLIIKEGKIRTAWIFFCYFITFCTSYYFAEDLFFGLAIPYFQVAKISFFICTQITESLSTYMMISFISGFVFCFPYIIYQIWSFLIPSCNQDQRETIKKILLVSFTIFIFFLIFTFLCILPNIWLFLYKLSNNVENSHFFIMKLQPKVYDFTLLTLRVLFITGIFSQIPILIIFSVGPNTNAIENWIKNRRLLWFFSILLAAFITPPDLWCQLSVWVFMTIFIEFSFFIAILHNQYLIKLNKIY